MTEKYVCIKDCKFSYKKQTHVYEKNRVFLIDPNFIKAYKAEIHTIYIGCWLNKFGLADTAFIEENFAREKEGKDYNELKDLFETLMDDRKVISCKQL